MMSPFPGLWVWLTHLCEEPSSSGDAETLAAREKPGVDTEDEERIYTIVQEQGGRARQQTIIAQTGWSPSKVSRGLSRMESKGCIARITTGREKIVVLPEYLPGQADAK